MEVLVANWFTCIQAGLIKRLVAVGVKRKMTAFELKTQMIV